MKKFKKITSLVLSLALVLSMVVIQPNTKATADEKNYNTTVVTRRSLSSEKSYTENVPASVASNDAVSLYVTGNESKSVSAPAVEANDGTVDVSYAIAKKLTTGCSVTAYVVKTTEITKVTTKSAVDDDGDTKVENVEKVTTINTTVAALQINVEPMDATKKLKVAKKYRKVIIPEGGQIVIPYTIIQKKTSLAPRTVTSSIKNTKVLSSAVVDEVNKTVTINGAKKAVKGNNTLVTLKSGNKTATIKVFIKNKAKKLKSEVSSATVNSGSTLKLKYKVIKAQNINNPIAAKMKLKVSKKNVISLVKTQSKKGKILVTIQGESKGTVKAKLQVNGKKANEVTITVK